MSIISLLHTVSRNHGYRIAKIPIAFDPSIRYSKYINITNIHPSNPTLIIDYFQADVEAKQAEGIAKTAEIAADQARAEVRAAGESRMKGAEESRQARAMVEQAKAALRKLQ
jgi:hypothetical protein